MKGRTIGLLPSQDAGRWINWRGSIRRANQQGEPRHFVGGVRTAQGLVPLNDQRENLAANCEDQSQLRRSPRSHLALSESDPSAFARTYSAWHGCPLPALSTCLELPHQNFRAAADVF